jgi:hypothetical protein
MKTPKTLSHEAIEEFKTIYQEECGRTLSDGDCQNPIEFYGLSHILA